jgi:AraC-like DNA-binding protein
MSQPRLFLSGARALYLGPALGLSPHRNAVAVLGVGLDQPFRAALDPADPGAEYRPCRSIVIPPNTLHHLSVARGRLAFLYVDAMSRDYEQLRERARVQDARAAYDLDIEDRLVDAFSELAAGSVSWRETRERLTALGALGAATKTDPRMALALQRLRERPADPHPLGELAAAAKLSDSRFLHLFKQATGVPLRRYKIWNRMGAAVQALGAGAALTNAALDAGFNSPSHFSASFREMFGAAPSALSLKGSIGVSS